MVHPIPEAARRSFSDDHSPDKCASLNAARTDAGMRPFAEIR